ncbi:MAG: type II secretion system protein [Patescibacteria group bacterium]
MKSYTKGFTLIELLVVIAIIALLSSIVIGALQSAREKAKYSRVQKEFNSIHTAVELYALDNNGQYPPDGNAALPTSLDTYLSATGVPTPPWPGTVYDWENWTIDGAKVLQISVRFCPSGGPLSSCRFPNESWASGFGVNSSLYYCVSGACRPHEFEAVTYPGKCVNCN